jgi:hypothetical protein
MKWWKTEARRDRGGLLEGASDGGADKRTGGVFFHSRALRGGNAGLRKEGEREVTAWRSGRATGVHTRAARRSSDVAVAAALRGGDAEGVCPYAIGEEVSWTGVAGGGHTACMGVLAHGACAVRGYGAGG